jgi:CDP-paratose 2-epimerase
VEDLLNAYQAAIQQIEIAAGQVYNVGGGPQNTISIWKEFGPALEELLGRQIRVEWQDWRPGDQRIYVSDIRKAKHELGWEPKISLQDGMGRLFEWIRANRKLFEA